MEIRSGSMDDFPAVMSLLDGAVAWLVANGRSEQWGTDPFTQRQPVIDMITRMVEDGDLFLAEIDGEPVGALVVNPVPMHYVAPIEEPELYIQLLVSSRRHKGQGIGSQLISFAREEAARREVSLLRVDCYAGPDEALIGYYESQGFVRSLLLELKSDDRVQVLEMRLD